MKRRSNNCKTAKELKVAKLVKEKGVFMVLYKTLHSALYSRRYVSGFRRWPRLRGKQLRRCFGAARNQAVVSGMWTLNRKNLFLIGVIIQPYHILHRL